MKLFTKQFNLLAVCFALLLFSVDSTAQCIRTSLYPAGTVTIPSDGSTATISTCNYTSEYSNLAGAVSGDTYNFTCTLSGTHKYVTITDGSDTVLGHGMSPFNWTSTITGDIRAHWSDDAACGSTSSCHVTTVQKVCLNSSLYPASTVAIPSSGAPVTISTCNYTSEYSNLSGAVSGETYEFTCTLTGTHKYVTITDAAGNVYGSGVSPFSWTASFTGDIQAHWSDDATCASTSSCHVTTAQCTSCAPAPVNNACGGALELVGVAAGNTATATDVEGLSACSSGGGGGTCSIGGTGFTNFGLGVWYYYTSTIGETITVSTDNVGSDFDTEIQVFEGSCGGLTCVGGDDDGGAGTLSTFCWASTASFAPVTYYIYVDGHGTATGNFVLTIATGLLPVELVSFDAKAMEDENMVTWQTATEENTQWHIVERSKDGQSDWMEIGRVEASGTSSEMLSYEYMDTAPLSIGYYRLRSVDFDAYEDVSAVVRVERERTTGEVSIYPNPTKGAANLEFELVQSEEVRLTMTDLSGKVISYQTVAAARGTNTIPVEMASLANGVYFISMETSLGKTTHRIVKN